MPTIRLDPMTVYELEAPSSPDSSLSSASVALLERELERANAHFAATELAVASIREAHSGTRAAGAYRGFGPPSHGGMSREDMFFLTPEVIIPVWSQLMNEATLAPSP